MDGERHLLNKHLTKKIDGCCGCGCCCWFLLVDGLLLLFFYMNKINMLDFNI